MERDNNITDTVADNQLGHSHNHDLEVGMIHSARHTSSARSVARSIAIVATCTIAMIVNISNITTVAISLPLIGKEVGIQEDQLQWLLSAYSLSSGCLLLLFGRLADLYGRKKGFAVGMLWQAIFALGLGFSNDGLTLNILRGLQGMGVAAAMPAAMGILAQSFPPSRARSVAFATFAAGAPLGGGFGNVLGSSLTQLSKEHWRAPFFLSAALSVLCVLGSLSTFDPDSISSEAVAGVDWIGAFLVTSGLVLIAFVLGQGPIAGWKFSFIITGTILLGIFIVWEHHLEKSALAPDKPKSFWTPPPLMKLSICTRAKGRMAVVLVVAFLNWAGFASWIFWIQLYYQNYLGLTPVLTMLRVIPMLVVGCLCNFFVAMVLSKLPLVAFIVSGTLLTGSACVLFALIHPSSTYWAYAFSSTVLVVFGADFVFTAGTIFVAKVVLPDEQSLAGGLFQTMIQIGTGFGLTISTFVFNNVVEVQSAKLGVPVNSEGTNALLSVELLGYRAAQWTSAAFPFFACLLAAIFLPRVGIIEQDAKQGSSDQIAIEQRVNAQP